MGEHAIQNAIRLHLAKVGPFFRTNVGRGWFGDVVSKAGGLLTLKNPRPMTTGLPNGFSDLVGITPMVVTPDMVGTTVGVFTALEVKSPTGKASREQLNFIEQVRKNGGIAGVVRSVEDANRLINTPQTGCK